MNAFDISHTISMTIILMNVAADAVERRDSDGFLIIGPLMVLVHIMYYSLKIRGQKVPLSNSTKFPCMFLFAVLSLSSRKITLKKFQEVVTSMPVSSCS